MSKLSRSAIAPGWAAAFVLLATASAGGGAHAADLFGSAGIITDRHCTEAGSCIPSSDPRLINPPHLFGGYQSSFSATETLPSPNDIPGSANATVGVSFGSDYLPTVRVGSQAGAETRTGASATAFQAFTYTGSTSIDLALNGQLHFLTSGDVALPDFNTPQEFAGDGTLNVVFALLRVSDVAAAFGPNSTANDIISNSNIDFADCSSGAIAEADFNTGGYAAGEYRVNVGLSQTCDGHAITLNPGDNYVVVATMQAISNRGGFLDATHTFSVQYDTQHTVYTGTDTPVGLDALQQSLSPSVAVPEPAEWALLITGFAGAGAVLRRQRRAALTRS